MWGVVGKGIRHFWAYAQIGDSSKITITTTIEITITITFEIFNVLLQLLSYFCIKKGLLILLKLLLFTITIFFLI